MRQLVCPLCKTPAPDSSADQELVKCASCHLTWTYLQDEVNQEELYQDEVYTVVDNRRSIFEKIIFKEARKVIRTVKKFSTSNSKKCLDFGCGKGQFLSQVQEQDWEGVGVETSIPRATFAREKYGLKVHEGFYKGGKIDAGDYDLISLFHVLEHLPSPLLLLEELCHENLKVKGILVIEVPNLKSWQHKIAGESWMHLDIPKHLSHWDEALLVGELQKLGFKKLNSQYYSVHLGVLGMLRSLMGKTGYKGNIIVDLKNKKKLSVLLRIALILPLAFFLESLAVAFKKGGVFRIYLQKHE
ncbi:hypothetical protein A33Q_4109 [Indibacter alkaliphilus LW1]|uniref:Methyltransferase n=1 Tax=Indibacter alkaliphilus (strain CCUG 57479 / KCTC 22604 / LW1) TaxID=1189612 RepID=S2DJ87_INDAL|nr:methyltransferase domain-containing protein [Indibacter alkaliphilus]EOZ92016.1 hypothetical protein A33Q_4109 [Indibacter alkaliphilus LW1]